MRKKFAPKSVTTLCLKNGLTLGFIKAPKTKMIQVDLIVRVGEYLETRKTLGYNHMLEHMMGDFPSIQFPNAIKNQKMLETKGIISNAWTDENTTGYFAKGDKKHLFFIIELLLCNFFYPILDIGQFKKEQNAVIQELNSIINDEWYTLDTKIDEIFYKGTIQAASIADEVKSVKKSSPQSISAFRSKYYKPNVTCIIFTGDFNKNKIIAKIKEIAPHFQPSRPHFRPNLKIPSFTKSGGRCIFVPNKNVNSYKIDILYRLNITAFSMKRFAISQLEDILTDGQSSRLFIRLRSIGGKIYNIYSNVELDPFIPQLCYFRITTTTNAKDVQLVINGIFEEIQKVKTELITDNEFKKLENKIKLDKTLESLSKTPSTYYDIYSDYIIWGKQIHSSKWEFEQLLKVSKNDIRKIANEIFNKQHLLISYSGKKNIKINIFNK